MIKKILHNIDMFSSLNSDEIEKLSQIIRVEKFESNNIVFYEGDDAKYFYLLISGELKLYKTGIKSQEVVLHYFSKPTLVGEMATLENIRFPATAVCMSSEAIIGKIEREKFIQMIQMSSNVSIDIIRSLTKKIKNLEISINRNLIFDATTKVCSLLDENRNIFYENKNIHIANLLNMTPETLSRTLGKLRKIEILDSENRLIDKEKLKMFLEF